MEKRKHELEVLREQINETEQQIATHKAFLDVGFYEDGLLNKLKTLESQRGIIDSRIDTTVNDYVNVLIKSIKDISLAGTTTSYEKGLQKTVIPLEISSENEMIDFTEFLELIDADAHIYSNPHNGTIEDIELFIKTIETEVGVTTKLSDEQRNALLTSLNEKVKQATKGVIGEEGISLVEALSNPEYLRFSDVQIELYEKLSSLIDVHFLITDKLALTQKQTDYRLASIDSLTEKLSELQEKEKSLTQALKLPNRVKSAVVKGTKAITAWLDKIIELTDTITDDKQSGDNLFSDIKQEYNDIVKSKASAVSTSVILKSAKHKLKEMEEIR